eukprot:TRINITY_DN4884_c0_g1_i1.p1 TRINITY_DN4884_c0_g1~~TRINITY_DN4884_c0_g1_i1.p1  ORF type:complete len:128 (-),score=41.55 TRINITY_DN4884_c0_g1_i1:46-429(-)
MSLKVITAEEVGKHNKEGDAWVIINNIVYDVSKFDHPGGLELIKPYFGQNMTEAFLENHQLDLLKGIEKNHSVITLGTTTASTKKFPYRYIGWAFGVFVLGAAIYGYSTGVFNLKEEKRKNRVLKRN